jgi:ABC-type Fe3+/spermidine/putrescine transport system ATPase subunit
MLRVENVSKRYGNIWALKNVQMSIEEGAYVAIIGPSGCGKTTLIKIISGIEKPTSGRIFIQGKDVTALSPSERKFGYVFQNIALFPHMPARENIAYPLKVRNTDKNTLKKIVNELGELFGISNYMDFYPRELPMGTQQSCGIARALATQHKLMLLDEPLSALDARVRKKLRVELRKFMKDFGVTVLHVTHDQEEALAVADKLCVMRSGEIIEIGKASQIYQQPRTLFGAFFLGEINFLDARIVEKEGKVYAETREGDVLEINSQYNEMRGERVILAIRPENVRPGDKNTIRAKFERTIFFGAYNVHIFEYGSTQIKMVSYNLDEKFNIGKEILLALSPEKILVYRIPPEGMVGAISLEKK